MARLSNPRTSRAVLIGSAEYTRLRALPSVRANLVGLAAALRDEYLWGLPEDNCRVLVDPASPLEVDLAVAEAAAAVRPDGLLIVYFAGHGLIERDGQTLYLGLVNTDRSRVHSTAVPYEWIHNTVRRSGTDRRLVILDCCYAGRADMAPMDAAESLAQSARIETACLLAAAAATEEAQAPPGTQYTAFTGELIKVLTEGLRGGPLLLDVGTIWQALRERLAPQYPAPQLKARNDGADIALVRNAVLHGRGRVGQVLYAPENVDTTELREAVVLILRYDPNVGAFGVRLNQLTNRPAAEVVAPDWQDLINDPGVVFDGGPTQHDGYIALGRVHLDKATPVRFTRVVGDIGVIRMSAPVSTVQDTLSDLRIFSGYFGWGPGELEADLAERVLVPTDASPEEAFTSRPSGLWHRLRHPERGEG